MDDGSPAGHLLAIFLLILGGGYFAGTEISLASVNRIRMMSYADDGNKRAKRVLYVLDNFDQALSTLLIGNNIMHIGAASLATVFATKMWGVSAVTAVTVVTTIVVFFVSEMIPKSYAKACSEKFALAASGPLVVLMKVLYPLSFVFSRLGDALQVVTGNDEEREPTVTEDELLDIIDTIEKDGTIDEETTDLVKNVLEFGDTHVKEIITDWQDVVKLSVGMNRERVLAIYEDNLYSRYPVIGNNGSILGVLQIRKYLKACTNASGRVPITSVMDRALYVDVTMPIDDLLAKLSSSMTHMAVVRGGEGDILGVVTVEDILEELVGEIYDESDEIPAAQSEDGSCDDPEDENGRDEA